MPSRFMRRSLLPLDPDVSLDVAGPIQPSLGFRSIAPFNIRALALPALLMPQSDS